jgi:hypothetical protein
MGGILGREWGVGEEVDGWCGVEVVIFLEEMGPVAAVYCHM